MKKHTDLKPLDCILIGLSILFVIIAMLAPWVLTRQSVFALGTLEQIKDFGALGDTIGGIMNPFIAIAVGLITFLAFRIQYNANKEQIERFDKEQNARQLENKHSQFEQQFYEMLRLHKENVNEMVINNNDVLYKGKDAFNQLNKVVEELFSSYPKNDANTKIRKVFDIIFFGAKSVSHYDPYDSTTLEYYHSTISRQYRQSTNLSKYLGHYYRHLYQMVKYVANTKQTEDLEDNTKEFSLSYNQKRHYLNLLRAQLSNQEQLMLYYNWKSGFGKNWENEDVQQHFFTDYRMIKNILADELCDDVFKKELIAWNEVYAEEKTISQDYIKENDIKVHKYKRKDKDGIKVVEDELFENAPKLDNEKEPQT